MQQSLGHKDVSTTMIHTHVLTRGAHGVRSPVERTQEPMKYVLALATAFLLLLLATPRVFAQGAGIEWDILNQEVMELYRTGKYDRAVVVAKKALEVAENNVGPNHPDVATSLNNLGLLYDTQGQYAQAEPLYKRSLAIKEKALGRDHPAVATTLNNLGSLYFAQGQYTPAEPLFDRARAIDEKALGPNHPNVARDLINLAFLYYTQGKHAQAEPLY